MFGKYLWAVFVLVLAIALLENVNRKWAYTLAALTLASLLLTNKKALADITALLGRL